MWLVLFVVEMALLVYCLIDCLQSDEGGVRNLPKGGWVLLIVLVPLAGGLAWLVAGRPLQMGTQRVPWPATQTSGFPEHEHRRPIGPDDDPAFLAAQRRSDERHEQMLREWEDQLRERERRLRDREDRATDEGDEGAR